MQGRKAGSRFTVDLGPGGVFKVGEQEQVYSRPLPWGSIQGRRTGSRFTVDLCYGGSIQGRRAEEGAGLQ